jgi:hypothetical protein
MANPRKKLDDTSSPTFADNAAREAAAELGQSLYVMHATSGIPLERIVLFYAIATEVESQGNGLTSDFVMFELMQQYKRGNLTFDIPVKETTTEETEPKQQSRPASPLLFTHASHQAASSKDDDQTPAFKK